MRKISVKFSAVLSVLCFAALNSSQATIITSAGDPALTGGTVIDFQSQTMGTYTSLAFGDVTFTANDRHLRIDNTNDYYGPTGNYLDNGTYGDMGFFDLTMNFAQPTSAVGFFWSMAEPAAVWNLTTYDASNTMIENYLLPNTDGGQGTFVGLANNNISYAKLVNASPANLNAGNGIGYDWISIDNFTYKTGSASVPEPSLLFLIGSGILALCGVGRKYKK